MNQSMNMKRTNHAESYALSSLILMFLPARERSWLFSSLGQNVTNMVPKRFEIEACGCLPIQLDSRRVA